MIGRYQTVASVFCSRQIINTYRKIPQLAQVNWNKIALQLAYRSFNLSMTQFIFKRMFYC